MQVTGWQESAFFYFTFETQDAIIWDGNDASNVRLICKHALLVLYQLTRPHEMVMIVDMID